MRASNDSGGSECAKGIVGEEHKRRGQLSGALLSEGRQGAADATVDGGARSAAEGAGDYLLQLEPPQVALGLVIVERQGAVVQRGEARVLGGNRRSSRSRGGLCLRPVRGGGPGGRENSGLAARPWRIAAAEWATRRARAGPPAGGAGRAPRCVVSALPMNITPEHRTRHAACPAERDP